MTEAEINNTLADILSAVLGRSVAPGENLTREQEERWDSLKHVEIVLAVEAAFGAQFSTEQIVAVSSVRDLQKVIVSHAT